MTRQVTRKQFPTREKATYRLGAAEAAVGLLAEQGLYLPPRPEMSVPGLPADPTVLSDGELMSQFSALQSWADYQSTQLAAAEVSEKYAEEDLGRFRALLAVENAGEKTVNAAKAKAYQNPEYLTYLEAQTAAYGYRKMVAAIYANTERKASVLSREITRRVGRNDREKRGN